MRSIRLLLTLALTLPTISLSVPFADAAGCSLTVPDTVAGLGTEASIMGCTPATKTSLIINGPGSTQSTQSIVLDESGNATTLIPSSATVTAGSYTASAAGATTSFTVAADRADDAHSLLSASPPSIHGDGRDTATITAVLRDRFDNPVQGRPIALLSNRTSDDIVATSTQTDSEGRFLWTVKTPQAGLITLIPYDILSNRQMKLRATVQAGNNLLASLTGTEEGGDPPIGADIAPVIVDRFDLALPQGATEVKANELFSLTIRAMHGQDLVRAYVGTLVVSSSDPDADLPKKGDDAQNPLKGRIDIRSVDQGTRSVPLAFVLRQGGKQTVTVEDKLDPTIHGEIAINVQSGNGSDGKMSIVSPPDRSKVKGTSVLLQGKAPSLVNLRVKGGAQVVDTESDSEGVFRVTVPLNPADKEVTLFVASENGTYESDPVHIIIDNDPPKIMTIGMNPEEGKTGDAGAITVVTDNDAAHVTANLQGKETALTMSDTTFTGTLTAPAQQGTYDITVIATDSVGNATTMLTKWTVKPKLTPVVQGLKAESLAQKVLLHWTAVDQVPIKEYKIYVADDADPTNVLYSVSTGTPTTSVALSDLPPGKTYRFSVTAITVAGEESPAHSAPVSAAPLGTALKITPGQNSLLVEWPAIPNLPLSQYILEFGNEAGVFPEKRIVNGQATSYILRDLIDHVTYYVKLTPVTVTGKTESALAATASGQPSGDGTFAAGPSETVPPDIAGDSSSSLHAGAPINTEPEGSNDLINAPGTAQSGIPTIVVMALVIATSAIMGLQWNHRRKERLLAEHFLRMMEDKYRSSY